MPGRERKGIRIFSCHLRGEWYSYFRDAAVKGVVLFVCVSAKEEHLWTFILLVHQQKGWINASSKAAIYYFTLMLAKQAISPQPWRERADIPLRSISSFAGYELKCNSRIGVK